jgi:hypothetical protein
MKRQTPLAFTHTSFYLEPIQRNRVITYLVYLVNIKIYKHKNLKQKKYIILLADLRTIDFPQVQSTNYSVTNTEKEEILKFSEGQRNKVFVSFISVCKQDNQIKTNK